MTTRNYGAKSTMTAVMGYMATYSGQFLEWEQALNSGRTVYPHHELKPEDVTWDITPPVSADEKGYYPVAVPGITDLL